MDGTLTKEENLTVGDADTAEFSRQFRSRNADILSLEEQGAVDAAKVLIAGCGTVAGSALEPLVRLGVSDFVLADPDVYDTSNLNRQACFFADVGRPKAEVLAERAKVINPYARAEAFIEGITPANVERAFEDVTFVCEGIDASMDLWAKYLVHHHAAQRGVPVVSGVDLGGQPTLYVFDYRADPRPFYGRGTEADHREGRVIEAIAWLGVRPLPADFAPIIVDRLRTGSPWPQTVYTAWGIGALMTRALVDLSLEREVPYVLRVDFHQLVRSRRGRVLERLRWPAALARARREANRVSRAGELVTPSPERSSPLPAGVSEELLPLVEAVRSAPSPGNLQPWSIGGEGRELRLAVEPTAFPAALDPEGRLAAQSLGCAIEAAASVAELELEPSIPGWPAEPLVATLRLDRIRADYSTRAGLLALRQTNRRPYRRREPSPELLRGLIEAAERHGVSVSAFHEPAQLAALADLGARMQAVRLRRLGREGGWHEVPPGALAPGNRLLQLSAALSGRSRALSRLLPGERALHRHTRDLLVHSGALVVLGWGEEPAEWVAAGRALMSLWLQATRARWAVHPLAVEEPGADLASVPARAGVSLPPGGFTLIRVGWAKRAPNAPRIPIERMVM